MATYTEKLNLTLPSGDEYVNIDDLNSNFQKIDDSFPTSNIVADMVTETLWGGNLAVNQTATLSKPYTDYDLIVVEAIINNSNSNKFHTTIPVETIKTTEMYHGSTLTYGSSIYLNAFIVKFNSATSMLFSTEYHVQWSAPIITAIYGIKTVNRLEDKEVAKKIPFAFGIDEDGNYGFIKDGADSVTPFLTPPVLLWENPTPTTGYTTKTLDIDSSKYNYIVFVTRLATTSDALPREITIYRKGQTGNHALTHGGTRRSRAVVITDSSISIQQSYAGSTADTNNGYLITTHIFGWNAPMLDQYVI